MGRADSLGRGKAWVPIVCRHHRRAPHFTGVLEGTHIDEGIIEGSEGYPRSRNLCIHKIIRGFMEDFLGMLWMFEISVFLILFPFLLLRYLLKREAPTILIFVVAMLLVIFYFWLFGLIRWILNPTVNFW